MSDEKTPADHAQLAADEAGFAGASLGAVRDEIEAGDLGAAAVAVEIAAVAARRAADHAVRGLRLALQPLEVARAVCAELTAADVPELVAPLRSVDASDAQWTTYGAAWERLIAARHALPEAERALSRLAESAALAGLFDGIDAAARAASLAAEAAELLAVALAPSPGCYGCETHRPPGKEHAIDCKHAAPRSPEG